MKGIDNKIGAKDNKLSRHAIINLIGCHHYDGGNIEGGEFSYCKALGRSIEGHFKLDIRFCDPARKVAVLVETKKISQKDKKQLFAYVALERELQPHNNIIAILAGTKDSRISVWKVVGDYEEKLEDSNIKTFDEYAGYFQVRNTNDKNAVLDNTAELNKILHDNGIKEKLRSQFVGTCLLALKNNLVYESLSTSQIIAGIREILNSMLNDSADKTAKIAILSSGVLGDKVVESLKKIIFNVYCLS